MVARDAWIQYISIQYISKDPPKTGCTIITSWFRTDLFKSDCFPFRRSSPVFPESATSRSDSPLFARFLIQPQSSSPAHPSFRSLSPLFLSLCISSYPLPATPGKTLPQPKPSNNTGPDPLIEQPVPEQPIDPDQPDTKKADFHPIETLTFKIAKKSLHICFGQSIIVD